MFWIDLVLLVYVALCVLIGIKKGFFSSFWSLLYGLGVSIGCFLLAKPVALFLNSIGLGSLFGGILKGGFEGLFAGQDFHSGWIGSMLSTFMGQDYMATATDAAQVAADFSAKVGSLITFLISFFVLVFVAKILLRLVFKVIQLLTPSGGNRKADKIAGGFFGVVKSFVEILLFCFVVFSFASIISSFGGWLDGQLAQNAIARTIYGWAQAIMQGLILPFALA